MLQVANRITKEREFARIYKDGKTVFGKYVILRCISNQKKISRFGFVVSSKLSKKATERNRMKRALREIIRPILEKIIGFDCVIIPKRNFISANFSQKSTDIQITLKKANIL